MQQKKEAGHTEVISIEEYLIRRKKARDMDTSQRRGRIPEENHTLVLAGRAASREKSSLLDYYDGGSSRELPDGWFPSLSGPYFVLVIRYTSVYA